MFYKLYNYTRYVFNIIRVIYNIIEYFSYQSHYNYNNEHTKIYT